MTNRWLTGWHTALLGIAALTLGARAAWAQAETGDAGDEGSCTASQLPLECPDRCPSYTTCFIDEGESRIYYRVGRERFDCDGLVCEAALRDLDDYCCRRGEYAPSGDGGCGCSIVTPRAPYQLGLGAGAACALVALVAARRRPRG